MSVKHAMLALLSAEPATTYQLRKRFDASTSQSFPLNIGQVSTTMQRLERDGLVIRLAEQGEESDAATQLWHLSEPGRAELARWWLQPVVAQHRDRDELVVKLALAPVTPGVDVAVLVQSQREATQRDMHDLTRLRRSLGDDDTVGKLVIDHHLFATEAVLRWLDEVEVYAGQMRPAAGSGGGVGAAGAAGGVGGVGAGAKQAGQRNGVTA